jgi:hypothetical protein
MFLRAMGAANVLIKLAHPPIIWDNIMPLARISSGSRQRTELGDAVLWAVLTR